MARTVARNRTVPRSPRTRSRTFVRLRAASLKDLKTLVDHRHRMLAELSFRTPREIAVHDRKFRRWALERLREGSLVGRIARLPTGETISSGCVWFREDQPRPGVSQSVVPYIMSVYTLPAFRRKGVAGQLVRALIAESRRRGYALVRLHASEQGMRLYTEVGFERTTEMRYWLDPTRRREAHLSRSESAIHP